MTCTSDKENNCAFWDRCGALYTKVRLLEYAHSFTVFYFVVVMSSVLVDSPMASFTNMV